MNDDDSAANTTPVVGEMVVKNLRVRYSSREIMSGDNGPMEEPKYPPGSVTIRTVCVYLSTTVWACSVAVVAI